jgi:uncharacterized integral membrane protein
VVTAADDAPPGSHASNRSLGRKARLAAGLIVVVAVLAIVVANRQSTRVSYVFGDARAPLVVVMLVSAVAGSLIGWLLLHRPRHRED